MSGSVILLTQHDFDLAPGAGVEVRSVSVYHPSSLESALKAAAPVPRTKRPERLGRAFASSSASMGFAFDWREPRSSRSRAKATSQSDCGPGWLSP